MNALEIFKYLNRLHLADQVHVRDGDQMVFYHWNRAMSDLIPSVVIQGDKIEQVYYPRSIVPRLYLIMNDKVENNFTMEEGYIRDKRGSTRRR